MARGHPYSTELRTAALAELAIGSSLTATAKQFGVGRATLQMWRQTAQLPPPTLSQRQTRERIGEQLFDYLSESIATLGFQLRFFRNEAWLEKQSAGDLAALHGTISDKAVRLLQALRGDDGTADRDAVLLAAPTPDTAAGD